MTEGMEKIRVRGEKETYKYLGILEADTIKHAKMKEKIKKEYPRRMGNYSKPNYIVEISSKRKIPWLFPSLDPGDHCYIIKK